MKKIISLLIILSTLLGLVSCKKNKEIKNAPTINGVKITRYQIVYDQDSLDYNKRAAEYIRDQIKERCGAELDIIDDDSSQGDYEIVVGETKRAISAELETPTEGLNFSMLVKDGSFALEGRLFVIAAAAYYFMHSYVLTSGYAATAENGLTVREPITEKANNYILLIGDGMGEYHTRIFEYMENNVEYGDGENFFYGYMLPYLGSSRTDSLSGTTDSAAGGTALSSGIKTENGNIGRDKDLNDVKSLTELAYEKGMAAAVMSTETKTGATPASFSAHADSRNSSTDIIKSQAETRDKYGTIIDCGFDYYTERYIEVIERHISDTLSKVSANEKGFFLMYEEAHTDKHSHSNNIEKLMNAMVRFNQAIGRFMEFCFYNPDTMLLITADHETGDLYPEENGQLKFHHDDHTSKDVLIFGYGQGAELFHGQNVENIQIAHTIASFMGEENFGDQSVYGSLTK